MACSLVFLFIRECGVNFVHLSYLILPFSGSFVNIGGS